MHYPRAIYSARKFCFFSSYSIKKDGTRNSLKPRHLSKFPLIPDVHESESSNIGTVAMVEEAVNLLSGQLERAQLIQEAK